MVVHSTLLRSCLRRLRWMRQLVDEDHRPRVGRAPRDRVRVRALAEHRHPALVGDLAQDLLLLGVRRERVQPVPVGVEQGRRGQVVVEGDRPVGGRAGEVERPPRGHAVSRPITRPAGSRWRSGSRCSCRAWPRRPAGSRSRCRQARCSTLVRVNAGNVFSRYISATLIAPVAQRSMNSGANGVIGWSGCSTASPHHLVEPLVPRHLADLVAARPQPGDQLGDVDLAGVGEVVDVARRQRLAAMWATAAANTSTGV